MNSTTTHIEKFRNEGFVLIEGLLSSSEIEDLKSQIADAVGKLKEESSLNAEGLVFHSNLFRYNEQLSQWLCSQKIAGEVESLVNAKLWIRWDQQISKMPGGVVFPWHRDNAYNKLKAEHYQLWLPLTEMTEQNGALWLIPRSHKMPRMHHEKIGPHWVTEGDDSKAICVEAKPGDLVVFSSWLLHKTGVNQTQGPRISYVVEYMKQENIDPGIEAPFLFVQNHQPVWKDRHPRDGFWKRRKALVSGSAVNREREV